MKTIIMVRHGESETNVRKVFTGQLDAPLTPMGKTQAELMAQYVNQYRVDKIYASSLQRAVETAQAIAAQQNCPLEKCDALRELDAGAWQGLSFEEIEELYPQSYQIWKTDIGSGAPEQGETCEALYRRVTAFLEDILSKEEEETVCLVSHAIPIRMIESYICGGSAALAQEMPWAPNASVTVYQYDGAFHPVVRGFCDFLREMRTNLPKNI